MSKDIGTEKNARIRILLREVVQADFGGSQSKAAKDLGVSQSYLSEVLAGKRGAGAKLIHVLSSNYPTEYSQRVTQLAEPQPSQIVVLDPRYPNRSAAIEALILLGEPREAVETAADEVGVALSSEDDPPPRWWSEQIEAALKRKDWRRVETVPVPVDDEEEDETLARFRKFKKKR